MKNSNLLQTMPERCTQAMSSGLPYFGMTRSPMSIIHSNPAELLPDRVVTEWPLDVNGDPQKKIVVKKNSNRSELEGLVFDRSMTLTGQLNDGVSLAEVSFDWQSNDPIERSRQLESDVLRVINAHPTDFFPEQNVEVNEVNKQIKQTEELKSE